MIASLTSIFLGILASASRTIHAAACGWLRADTRKTKSTSCSSLPESTSDSLPASYEIAFIFHQGMRRGSPFS